MRFDVTTMSRSQGSSPGETIKLVSGYNASLDVFKIGDNYQIFEERLEQLFTANLIDDDRKVSVLLTSISVEV